MIPKTAKLIITKTFLIIKTLNNMNSIYGFRTGTQA